MILLFFLIFFSRKIRRIIPAGQLLYSLQNKWNSNGHQPPGYEYQSMFLFRMDRYVFTYQSTRPVIECHMASDTCTLDPYLFAVSQGSVAFQVSSLSPISIVKISTNAPAASPKTGVTYSYMALIVLAAMAGAIICFRNYRRA